MCLFVPFLHHEKFAPRTISTYLPALSYVHKILNLSDPTSVFLISKLVAGAYRLNHRPDMRFPITVPILNQLIASLEWVTSSIYDCYLFQAMFILAFNSDARIGEITLKSLESRVLQFSDISIAVVAGKATSVGNV